MSFRLARELGVWDVPSMMDEMPMSLLVEWSAFIALESEDQGKQAQSVAKKPGVATHWRDMMGLMGTRVKPAPA